MATIHWLTKFHPQDGEPYGETCTCEIGADHDGTGTLNGPETWDDPEPDPAPAADRAPCPYCHRVIPFCTMTTCTHPEVAPAPLPNDITWLDPLVVDEVLRAHRDPLVAALAAELDTERHAFQAHHNPHKRDTCEADGQFSNQCNGRATDDVHRTSHLVIADYLEKTRVR